MFIASHLQVNPEVAGSVDRQPPHDLFRAVFRAHSKLNEPPQELHPAWRSNPHMPRLQTGKGIFNETQTFAFHLPVTDLYGAHNLGLGVRFDGRYPRSECADRRLCGAWR
jgi:hypothetical protein